MVRGRIIPTGSIPGFLTHDNNLTTAWNWRKFWYVVQLNILNNTSRFRSVVCLLLWVKKPWYGAWGKYDIFKRNILRSQFTAISIFFHVLIFSLSNFWNQNDRYPIFAVQNSGQSKRKNEKLVVLLIGLSTVFICICITDEFSM